MSGGNRDVSCKWIEIMGIGQEGNMN